MPIAYGAAKRLNSICTPRASGYNATIATLQETYCHSSLDIHDQPSVRRF